MKIPASVMGIARVWTLAGMGATGLAVAACDDADDDGAAEVGEQGHEVESEADLAEPRQDERGRSPSQGRLDAPPAQLASELAFYEGCDEREASHHSNLVGISSVDVYRHSLDMDGSRLVGCVHNQSSEAITTLELRYRRSGETTRSGSTPVRVYPLEPGASTAFVTGEVFRDDHDQDEVDHFEFTTVATSSMTDAEYELTPEIQVPATSEDRPRHDLEDSCEDVDQDDEGGDVRIHRARLEPRGLPGSAQYPIVGCVENGTDETLADGFTSGITAVYTITGERGGTGATRVQTGNTRLHVAEPLEPGESAFFFADVEVSDPEVSVELQPMAGLDPAGPEVTVSYGD